MNLKIPISSLDHSKGPTDAPLELVEYGDFQCSFCADAHFKLKSAEHDLGRHTRLVFRHFPLTQTHEWALSAAFTAEAAGRQGKFWEMHDLLFENQMLFGWDTFGKFAQELDLDLERFMADQHDKSLIEKIRSDFMGGVRSGVNGTPGFFINGIKVEGPLESSLLREIIEAA